MTVNAHPEYLAAEKEYYKAENDEDRLLALEKMISVLPSHKGAENLRAQIKLRYKKLKEKIENEKKSKKGIKKESIKKEELQAVIIGKTHSGKSSFMNIVTNNFTEIGDYEFVTRSPVIGIMNYEDVNIQLIEIPAINSKYYDRGLVNNADVLLIFIEKLEDLEEINKLIEKAPGERIIVFTKSDKLNENEKRRISANLSTKKYNFVLISSYTKEGIEELKKRTFQSFKKIRIYTKQPEDKERSLKPMILKPDVSVKDVAEKIFKGFSKKIKETRIWGPSSDYPGQVVGLNHKLKDLDTVEFKTR
jgi:ribosome-interacting GTPase 1